MIAKQQKHYEILCEFFASDLLKSVVVEKYFGAMLKLDFTFAEDLWEYMLIRNDAELKNTAVAALYVDKVYGMFNAVSAQKTQKTLLDRSVVLRACFQFSPAVATGDLFMTAVNLLVANKIDSVDAILKCVAKNVAMKQSFGGYMVTFLDRFFIEMMKKSSQRRVELNRKQYSFLLEQVQKVRGDERAMLIQRVKEVG